MINSRDINQLRPDVAANCKIFLQLCADEGLPVLVTCTVRDQEQQTVYYLNGTGGKTVTFHKLGIGLAFDICRNVKGHEYDDADGFFEKAAAIGERIGFTWGGYWKRVDKPHFQWDNNKNTKDSDIIAGVLPPDMPLYEEDEMATVMEKIAQVAGLSEEDTIKALGLLCKFANRTEEPWEKTGSQNLVDMGLITTPRDGRELVEMGELGTILKRFKSLLTP